MPAAGKGGAVQVAHKPVLFWAWLKSNTAPNGDMSFAAAGAGRSVNCQQL